MWGKMNISINIHSKRFFHINSSVCPVVLSKLGQTKKGELSRCGIKSDYKICNACRTSFYKNKSKQEDGTCDIFYRLKNLNPEIEDNTVFMVSFYMPLELVDKSIVESK